MLLTLAPSVILEEFSLVLQDFELTFNLKGVAQSLQLLFNLQKVVRVHGR